ncbi:urea amidolyase [Acuticoccus sp. MNP-M23]|uniref:5-oxoprolinase subunit C family protein n=1 Tax=Acuticoccus sp. MNP-M23 TaxID=3072793 RepID=UPI002816128B|nr:urea amidolyase [Acuticoccus sp. MNP-M23]WMS44257.1 urea amidolyase [Acuticoccus sp. MNP-M23]
MSALHVVRHNHLVTVQDAGRSGAMRFGVSQSGPMDWVRFRHALALAGSGTAAFEIGIAGAAFRAEGPVLAGLSGPGFSATVGDGEPVTLPARLFIGDGETLTITPGRNGMWAYLAVAGIDLGAPVLGSYATNARTGLGARDFDTPFSVQTPGDAEPLLAVDIALPDGPIGLLPGPQHHLFAEEVQTTFTTEAYRLTDKVDRMGYRLEGPPLEAATHDIISDGIVEGAIQVPGNGQPIVLCADRAPTGGYPKIAVVALADRPRLTQLRPGATVHFAFIDLAEAGRRRRALEDALAAPPVPRVRSVFTSEYLASRNLIGGVVSGDDQAP